MYYVYVLRSKKTGTLYKGMSNCIERRLKEHNANKCPGTRGKGPWDLVYWEALEDRKTARKREKFFKSGEGRELLKQILSFD